MTVDLLAVNVGNTRSQFAAVVGDELQAVHQLPHDLAEALPAELTDAMSPLAERADAPVYVASVNDRRAEELATMLRSRFDREVVRVERDVNVPIGRRLDRETIVGVDRLLNAAAAYDRLQQACIVIDAGTAVTIDFVDGEGIFHGGAILPGGRLQLQAMHAHTALLPDVEFARPDEPIGHNTAQAMRSGVFHGIRGAVRELAELYAEHYGAYPKIIATGGDARDLFEGYELVEAIVPALTLLGMVVTRRRELEQEGAG